VSAPGATRQLAAFVIEGRLEDLPADVRAVARTAVLDVLGVGIAAFDEPLAKPLLALAPAVAGGPPLLAQRQRTSPLEAALINGTLCHALDFDDTYQAVPIHPSASLVPALLAAAHGRRVTGADFVAAYAFAAETALRIGLAAGRSHIERGWHGTGTFGTFGAAAGAGRILGLSVDQMETAFGIAAVQAAGLLAAAAGTMAKPLHAGKAAMNGLLAAQLAATGFTGPRAVLERRHGFTEVYSDGPVPEAYGAGLGRSWRLADLSFKLYACCSQTHAVIDAARALRQAGITDLGVIQGVTIEANPVAATVAGISLPRRGLEGKFSLAFTTAAALAGRPMTPETFTDASVGTLELEDLCRRTTVEVSGGYADTEAAVTLRLADGKEVREYVPVARGNPGNPCLADEITTKFLALTEPVLGREQATRLRDVVDRLDMLPDLSHLTELLQIA
jgi:2-methylcitrate dehydratase PrpD